ncbi:MAG: hypothetical protein ACREBE_00025 [bacterium]
MIPVAPPASRVLLCAGDEAGCLLLELAGKRSRSGKRWTIRGAARVRVESVEGDTFHVVIIAASGGRPGERLAYKREALYATQGDERRTFEQLIAFLWSDR